jgi:threonine synthase
MMAQMQAYGARVVATERAADRWTLMRHAVEHWGWYPASNYLSPPIGSNPYGVEGYKTFAYELAEDCDWRPPEHVVFPVCYADGLFGATKGFKELADAGLIDDLPRVHAAEVFGSLEAALADGADRIRAMPTTDTVAISIGAPASTYQGLSALRLTGGRARRTTDDELVAMQRRLGECEGLYVEASSVPALVVAARLKQEGVIGADDRVVCILTATGLKDPGVTARASGEVPVVSPSPDDLERALRDTYGLVVAG